MTDNPFQPPRAPLEIAQAPRDRGPPPTSVKFAVKALWISAALLVPFIVALAIGLPLPGGTSTFVDVAGNLMVLGYLIFFAKKISAARNWARWTYAILTGLGAAFMLYSYVAAADTWSMLPFVLRAYNWLQSLLQLASAALLFVPTANAWFSKIDAA